MEHLIMEIRLVNLIQRFSFGMQVNDRHKNILTTMYSASNGYIYQHNINKDEPIYGLIVRVGGPHSIGLGGGAALSRSR